MDQLRYQIAAEVNKNNAGELGALEEYSKLLSSLEEAKRRTLDPELVKLLQEGIDLTKEISADEKNHSVRWLAYAAKLDKIGAAKDGLNEALNVMSQGSQ